MVKDIVKVLLLLAFASLLIYFGDQILNFLDMLLSSSNVLMTGIILVIDIITIPFNVMLQYNYIYLILGIGVIFYVISYVMKLITGHHLVEEDDTEDVNNQLDKLDKEELDIDEDYNYWNYRKENANSESAEILANYKLNKITTRRVYNQERRKQIINNRKGKTYKWKRKRT